MRRRWPILVWSAVVFLTGSVCAEESPVEKTPELRGVLAEGNGKRFGLFIPGSGQTGWATVGQSVGGWKLKEYRAADEVLVLAKADREEVLRLKESAAGTYHAGTVADAKALLDAMKYEQRVRLHWVQGISTQMLISHGLRNPTAGQLAEFEQEITRLFDHAKMQSLVAGVMSEVYSREELRAQAALYGSDAGQAALDQQMRGTQALDEKEPAALAEFYATPVGRGVKAKEALIESKMQAAVTPWLQETMEAIERAAVAYTKAQPKAAPVNAP